MSPRLFSVYTENIMREVEEEQSNSEYDELSSEEPKLLNLDMQMTRLYSVQHLRV